MFRSNITSCHITTHSRLHTQRNVMLCFTMPCQSQLFWREELYNYAINRLILAFLPSLCYSSIHPYHLPSPVTMSSSPTMIQVASSLSSSPCVVMWPDLTPPPLLRQVLSGDAVIVRGQPKGGPPPERQINFSNVVAPRTARRATNKWVEGVNWRKKIMLLLLLLLLLLLVPTVPLRRLMSPMHGRAVSSCVRRWLARRFSLP